MNMKVFKSYVNNRNRLEGCIVEKLHCGGLHQFFFGYVERMEYIGSMQSRNDAWYVEEGKVGHYGKALPSGTSIELDNTSLVQSHRWILHNIDEVQPWIE